MDAIKLPDDFPQINNLQWHMFTLIKCEFDQECDLLKLIIEKERINT